jgi:regulatory protein
MKLLAARALSTGEVRLKLRRKAANAEDIEPIIARLREYGVVNDAKFADNYATARRDHEGFGKLRVIRDLRQRRVAPALADRAAAAAFEGTDEVQMIESFLARKFRNVNLAEHLQDERRLQAAYRRLRYAGFSSGASIGVLKRYADRAGDLEGSEDEPDSGTE